MTTELPEGWRGVALGSIADTQLGKMLNSRNQTGRASLPYLRNINLRWGGFDLSDLKQMDVFPDEIEQFTVRRGDLLLCEGGEPGRCAVWWGEDGMAFQNAMHRIRTHEGLSATFLSHQFESKVKGGELDHLFSGVTIKHFSQQKLRAVPIIVPPYPEQERIVEILNEQFSRLDSALASVKAVRDKAQAFRRSLLHAAFNGELTGGTEGWREIPLTELARGGEFFDGDWVESKDQDPTGSVRLVQLADVGEGVYRHRSDRWLRNDQAERLGVTYLEEGDLLVARMPDPMGRCCRVPHLPTDAVTVVDVAVLRIVRPDLNPDFVMWAINSPAQRAQITAVASGTTRQRISRKNLGLVQMHVPPISEQDRIVGILEEQFSRLDNALEVANQLEARIAAERRSLLHSAFTGELTAQWRATHV